MLYEGPLQSGSGHSEPEETPGEELSAKLGQPQLWVQASLHDVMHIAHEECCRKQAAFLPFSLFQARQSELIFACSTPLCGKGGQLLSRPETPRAEEVLG